jgi:hypothetical protein
LAIAFAVKVLPVPGRPYRRTPVGQGVILLLPISERERERGIGLASGSDIDT